ncbi:class III lanthionine synthetase LanKC [Streptomyces europaeiscabiei]|uniref:class III lanthionine synthetase LanKC n=1 Tax=Streptomyces europaeiscabiei TaxID=146819 RepID=UPI0029B7CD74|nr:class III lanthionine synthetase LanKC [Streptomyces europaeiscabiei]MDX3784177.1 class III lanthionine synthetase LanKC [Streptomyces europaeiscabiei]
MDLRYVTYCQADNAFYEDPATAAATEPAEVVAEPPAGWTRSVNSDWVVLTPPHTELPGQGWKIHVSATRDNADRILDTVRAYCVRERLTFKYIRSAKVLSRRNSKYGDRGASGKFITVYPLDEARLERVLVELDAEIGGEPGPYILSDLRWRSGPLYVRYGGFVARLGRDAKGDPVHCIEDPDGRLVPDVRGPGFRPPAWVTLPDCLAESLAARNASTMGDFPFRAVRALHFSNGGGVYEAADLRQGPGTEASASVLLKEARPLAGLDEEGADAVSRLERERWALERLAGLDCVPPLIDYRKGREHYFLTREFVPGASLHTRIHESNPLLCPDADASPESFAAYTSWALSVIDQIDAGVRAMHARGVVFGDLHPNNVMVRPDDTIAFIDLETASPVDDAAPQAIGAPGFRAPAGYVGAAVDRYALGCLRLAVFLPLTVVVGWGREKTQQLIALVTENFPVPADFAERVAADLAGPEGSEAIEAAEADVAAEADAEAEADADSETAVSGERAAAPVWPETLTPADWPSLRASLAAGILATATPDREDRLFPGDIAQFTAPGGGLDLAHGAAGVLWALGSAGTEIPAAHVDWLTERVRRWADPRPGFYDGLHGIAYALDALGRTVEAREVLDRALALPMDDLDGSLCAGLPGIGLSLLHFGHLDAAERLAELVADRTPGGYAARPRPGLLYGATGAALFLLRLYEKTGDRKLLHGAVEALRHDLAELSAGPGISRMPYLAVGGAGVAMVVSDVLPHLPSPEPELNDSLLLLQSSLAAPYQAQAGLFQGRAGATLALRHLRDRTPEPEPKPEPEPESESEPESELGSKSETEAAVRRHLVAFGWHAIPYAGHPAFLGDQTLRLSTDLATGTAGVLLALDEALGSGGSLPFFPSSRRRPS